jgi:hypothetical protein
MKITVKDCWHCVFINEGELDTICNAYTSPEPFGHKLTHDEYEMEFGLPCKDGEFPKLCPLRSGEVIVSMEVQDGEM